MVLSPTVTCSWCGALRGQPCSERGKPLEQYHWTRIGWPQGGPDYGDNLN